MLDRGKDLSITGSETNQDLKPDFTFEELQADIWKDLDAQFMLPLRQKGDIDVSQMMARYGGHENTARERMKQMVKSGAYEFVIVADETSQTGKRKVIRKKK